MDAARFLREIRGSSAMLEKLGLQKTLIQLTSLAVDEEFRTVALDPNSSYADVFRIGLSRSQYNIILFDYSFFQFSYFSEENWRLAYLPNPWLTGVAQAQSMQREWETLEEIGGLTHEDGSSLLSEMEYAAAVPPIRFELALRQYREFDHPAAHFHIGHHSENRWPSSISLGPLSFAMLIAKLYYIESWKQFSGYADGTQEGCIEQAFLRSISETSLVAQNYFSDVEKRSFHFGRGLSGERINIVDATLDRLGLKKRSAK